MTTARDRGTSTRAAPPDWRDRAACRPGSGVDAEIFFPLSGSDDETNAVLTCRRCAVRQACLADALTLRARDDWGIRGGHTADERHALRGGRPATEPTTIAPCGTLAAYARHHRAGETPCTDCRTAAAAYSRLRRSHQREAS